MASLSRTLMRSGECSASISVIETDNPHESENDVPMAEAGSTQAFGDVLVAGANAAFPSDKLVASVEEATNLSDVNETPPSNVIVISNDADSVIDNRLDISMMEDDGKSEMSNNYIEIVQMDGGNVAGDISQAFLKIGAPKDSAAMTAAPGHDPAEWESSPAGVYAGKLTCTYCGRVFPTEALLKLHLPVHTAGSSVESSLPKIKREPSADARNVAAKQHTRLSDPHDSLTQAHAFQCHFCMNAYVTFAELCHHLRSHSHQCSTCARTFQTSRQLEIHVRTHLAEELIVCPVCNVYFKTKQLLKTHMTAEHEIAMKMRPASAICPPDTTDLIIKKELITEDDLDPINLMNSVSQPHVIVQDIFKSGPGACTFKSHVDYSDKSGDTYDVCDTKTVKLESEYSAMTPLDYAKTSDQAQVYHDHFVDDDISTIVSPTQFKQELGILSVADKDWGTSEEEKVISDWEDSGDEEVPTSSQNATLKRKDRKQYPCTVCSKRYISKYLLLRHMTAHTVTQPLNDVMEAVHDSMERADEEAIEPAPVRTTKGQRKSVNYGWQLEFKWLEFTDGGNGMMCQLCKKYNAHAKNGSQVWSRLPSTRLRRATVLEHGKSEMHAASVAKEAAAIMARQCGGIKEVPSSQISVDRGTVIAQLKVMFWLIREEVALTDKFNSLIRLVRDIGCSELGTITAEKAEYTSQHAISDHARALSSVIRDDLVLDLKESCFYSVILDGTTDIAVTKRLIVYVRYLNGRVLKTSFAATEQLPDGKVETIIHHLHLILDRLGLPLSQMVALGSDGAPVMVDTENGVGTKLRQEADHLLSLHCVTHGVALAAAQAAAGISYMTKFKDILRQLWVYYETKSARTAGLPAMQATLQDPHLELVQANDMQWMSHNAAVSALQRSFISVIRSLSRDASERNCPTALGLHMFLRSYDFVASLYMLSDILPHLDQLSTLFQNEDVDFGLVQPAVEATMHVLEGFLEERGELFTELDSELKNGSLKSFIIVEAGEKESFEQEVYIPFVKQLVRNIKDRFRDLGVLSAFSVFDPRLLPLPTESDFRSYGNDKLEVLADHWSSIKLIDSQDMKHEFRSLRYIMAKEYSGTNAIPLPQMCHVIASMGDLYPNCAKLAKFALILPLSSVDCERGFSAMKRIKAGLGPDVSNQLLEDCMLVSVHGGEMDAFSFESAVNKWEAVTSRKVVVKKDQQRVHGQQQLQQHSLGARKLILRPWPHWDHTRATARRSMRHRRGIQRGFVQMKRRPMLFHGSLVQNGAKVDTAK